MRCNDCGATFDMADKKIEKQGEYWGEPAYEEWYVCPECGSDDIENTVECVRCGRQGKEELCEDCIAELSDEDTVMAFSDYTSEEIALGGLYTCNFTQKEIENILLRELKNSGKWQKIKDEFIHDDYDYYVDWLEEQEI